jgi:alpha-ribazole phosphatase/probable phosphoglycerate mutase
MQRTRLHLIRHGEVEGAEEKRYNGQSDVPLTPKGMAQIGFLQMRIKKFPITAVYCSDLTRCVEGATLLAAGYELQPIQNRDLREIDAGDWQGMAWDEILKKHPKLWKKRLDDIVNIPFPNGENLVDVAERVRPVIQSLVEQHRGEDILVVAHGGVNRIILLDAIGAPLESLFSIEQDFGCLNSVDYYADGNAVVRLLNG